ncbi:MAG: protein rep [Pseudomonas sp.]
MAKTVRQCGDYLVFRHYFTVDKVRLHGASLCRKHLLCPLCAIRRGAKSLAAYLQRWEVIKAEKPHLRPFLVTLTVKDGDDLAERFKHLHKAQRELWKRKHRGRGSSLDGVHGAVWSYEVKRGSGSGVWHPHLHMIALAEHQPDADELAAEWKSITVDSYIVDVRPISQEDPASGFIEVFKYAVKFSDQPPADTVHAWETLAGKRLLGSAGAFRGVEVPESLLDDPEGFGELPWVALFYRYLRGRGYHLERTGSPLAAIPPEPRVRGSKRSAAPSPHHGRASPRQHVSPPLPHLAGRSP